MGYAYTSAATTHVQVTGAPVFKIVVGSVTLLVSIAKRDDWEVITTKSDRVASDSAMPLVSGWGPKTTQQALLGSLCGDLHLVCTNDSVICKRNGIVEDCQLSGCQPSRPASCNGSGS